MNIMATWCLREGGLQSVMLVSGVSSQVVDGMC